ncbi:hypothetical protein L3Q82_026191, partial [Scortum barcoo]
MQRSRCLYLRFVTDAASGLSFSLDSTDDLCPGNISYSEADFRQLFKPTGALKPSARRLRTREKKLCRPTRELKGRQDPPLLELLEISDYLPVRLETAESSLHVKEASGLAKPVHVVAHQDHIILDNSSKYHKKVQRWSSPAPQRWTGLHQVAAHPDQKSVTTGIPKRDQTYLTDQVQPTVSASWTPPGPGPQSGSGEDSESSDSDSWAAAQYSAHDGDHNRRVIQRLLAQLFHSQDRDPSGQDRPLDPRLVVSLLTSLSSRTALVRSLLAEQLNSSEWSSRLTACNALSGLKGPINKDVVHKLRDLMWSEQRCMVRLAAAEALKKLGKVQHVHRDLRLKLEEGRMEALDIVVQLKLMTVTLLEPFVSCLSDESASVRKQACETAGGLLLSEEAVRETANTEQMTCRMFAFASVSKLFPVVSCLLELLVNDPAKEVRLSAIRAVGALALPSSEVQEVLQLSVETDEEAELRLASCHLLQSAGASSAQLKDFLLQRLQVEDSRPVRRMMKEMLHRFNRSLQEEHHTATHINLQMKHVYEWRVLAEKVLLLEKLQAEGTPGQSKSPA